MGITLLILISAAAGFGVACLLWLPTRATLHKFRQTLGRVKSGDWRHRADISPYAARDVRRILGLYNTVADKTLRDLKDLSRQRGDLRALVDALPDPLVLADTRRKVLQLNRPAAERLGVSVESAIGAPLESVVTEPAILAVFDRAARIERDDVGEDGRRLLPLRRELRLNRAGKVLVYQAVATRTDAGGVLVVLRDISTLDQTLRMKTDFVANAGHELRTPVAAIKAATETLQDVVGPDGRSVEAEAREPAQRCLRIITGHTQRLEEMLRDLLDLSRVESGEIDPVLEAVPLAEIGRELRSMLGPLAQSRRISLHLPDEGDGRRDRETIVTDRRVLMLALRNLVENAIKYTPEGGDAWLEADPESGPELIRLAVRDTGVGIAPEHVERVFERFYQVDSARTGTNAMTLPATSGRGTGLGLSIVKHAVSALGGRVEVKSEVGRGTRFTVELPRRGEGAAEAAHRAT